MIYIYSKVYKNIISVFIAAFFITASLPLSLLSQQSGGGYSSPYLLRQTGARINGMAGAYTAVVNEPNSVFINPAGLGFLNEKPIIISSVTLPGLNRSHSNLAYGQRINENIGIGAGINSFSSPSFMGRDLAGNPTGNLTEWQYSMNISGAYSTEDYSFGATAKYVGRSLTGGDASANGYAFDIGTKFNVADLFSFGAAVNNLGGVLKWNTNSEQQDKLPLNIRTGVAMEIALNDETISKKTSITGEVETIYIPATQYILFALDAVFTEHQKSPNFILGTEIVPIEEIAIRGGVNIYGEDNFGQSKLLPLNIWGTGLSIRPNIADMPFNLNIDYSISNEILLGSGVAHHISLVFDLN